ncbi:exported hypothetical protein [Candidatus Zixiibacteriota bacterium]|nr:exported hypothetical protein [candidate division Zixibacteria bacterium]
MSRLRQLITVPLVLFLAGLPVMSPRPARADTVDVSITGFTFSPSSLTINEGQTVRWTNNDPITHTTTSDDLIWDSGFLSNGQKFAFTFNTAGSYPYHCTVHLTMLGTITVNPASCCVMPGDVNNNGVINILDVSALINFLYKSGPTPPCPAQADVNGNGATNILDVSALINFLYKSGPAPQCPA